MNAGQVLRKPLTVFAPWETVLQCLVLRSR